MDPLAPFDTPEKLARFLAVVGSPRDDSIALVRADFPDADVEQLVDDARAANSRDESELDQLARAEEGRARAAEVDLSKSMHEGR